MIMVYGFMGYLNHVDLLMPQEHVLKKQRYCLMQLSCFVWILSCANQDISYYLWMITWMKKVNNFQITKVQPWGAA